MDFWKLPNGLTAVGERMPAIRTVSVGVWNHVGAMMEAPEENGMSHLIEHMVFKGTQTRSTRQLAAEMDQVGGNVNAFTARDTTCYHATVIDEDLPRAVDLLADLTLNPVFDPEELEKERGVVLDEIAMAEDDPEDVVSELLNSAQFGGTPVGLPVLGPAEQVERYSREALIGYRRRHYAPERCVVSVAGNYDPAQVEDLLQRIFGAWRSEASPLSPAAYTPSEGVALAREKDTEQLHLALGYPGIPFGDDRAIALNIMNTVLGGAMSSRLFQRIREELGMAYSVYSYAGGGEGFGAFSLYAGVAPKNGRRVLDEMLAQARLIRDEGITPEEFAQAKHQLRIGYLMGLESSSARMMALGRAQLILGRCRTPDEVLSRVDAVTPNDVAEISQRILSAQPCLAAVGPGAETYLEGWQ